MIGDGINDVFVLVYVNVGFVIGIGIDVVIESVDIMLMWGFLYGLVDVIVVSKVMLRNIK